MFWVGVVLAVGAGDYLWGKYKKSTALAAVKSTEGDANKASFANASGKECDAFLRRYNELMMQIRSASSASEVSRLTRELDNVGRQMMRLGCTIPEPVFDQQSHYQQP